MRSDLIVSGVIRSAGAGSVDVTARHDIQTATTLASAGGNITLHSPVVLNGATAVVDSLAGNITFNAAVDSASATHNDLTLTAGSGTVTLTGAVGFGQTLGNLSVTSSGSFVESNGIQAQSVGVTATNDVTFTGAVTTTAAVAGAGTVTVVADSDGIGGGTFTESAGVDASGSNSAVSITADQVSLTGAIKSGTATTTIQGSDNETIGLGSGAGHIQLTNTVLGLITSGALTIGGTKTGTITADTATTGSQQGPVTLDAGSSNAGTDVVFSGGASTFAALDVTANDQIQIGTTVNSNGGDITFHTQTFLTSPSAVASLGGDITFSSTVDSKTATAEGLTITAGAGDVTFTGAVGFVNPLAALSVVSSHNFLESAGIKAQSVSVVSTNDVTFNGSVTTTASVAGTGTVTVNADSDGDGVGTFTETAGVDTSGSNSALSIKADQLNLTGTLKSGTAKTTIEASDNETIGLGSAQVTSN